MNKGFVNVEALADLIRPDTTLVSVMAVNNEIGSIQPIQAISELLADKPLFPSTLMRFRRLPRFRLKSI